MKLTSIFAAIVLTLGGAASSLFGQGMPETPNTTAADRLGKLLGAATGFSATSTSSTLNSEKSGTVSEMTYAVRDGLVRMEIDMTKSQKMKKGKFVTTNNEDAEQMTKMGMGKMLILVRPDKRATYLVYPGLKSYCEAPKKTIAADGKQSTTEWKELGRENIDDHPCVKYLATTTNPDGTTETCNAWKASDLQDFIIQTVSTSGDDTTTLKFSNIKTEKPAASLFEIPSDFRQYGSVRELMMGAMQQMMQNMGN